MSSLTPQNEHFRDLTAFEKYRIAKWNVLCHPKSEGGLGIQDLEIKTFPFSVNGYINY